MKQMVHDPSMRPISIHPPSQKNRYTRYSRTSRAEAMRRGEHRTELPQEVKPKLYQKQSSSAMSEFSDLKPRGSLTGKNYWNEIINEVEHAVYCQTEPRIPLIDYSLILPPRLRERVKHIQEYDYSKSDQDIYIREELREERPQDYMDHEETDSEALKFEQQFQQYNIGRKKVEEHFSESQHSEIVRMDAEFEKFDLKLDEPVGHTAGKLDKENWMAKFLCMSRDDRICWDSRTEKAARARMPISLDVQAEKLMDASAERFIAWLKSIGSATTNMTPDKVKALFSIKGDRTLLASVKTDPKEVNAIAQTVADKWNKPHMAIELKYEKHITDHATRAIQKPLLSAFGRTVPLSERPWVKRSGERIIETVYPEELLTREKIFKGITHLRSTSALIDFYLSNPHLPRPQYLLEVGDFEELTTSESLMEVPLYEYLGLRY